MTVTATTYQSTANITCNNGYAANKNSIECLSSGSWEVPLCTIKGIVSLSSHFEYFKARFNENMQLIILFAIN